MNKLIRQINRISQCIRRKLAPTTITKHMDTQTLKHEVAQFFPTEYAPDTWKELLPRFITQHIERYDQQVQAYLLSLPDCEPDDPRLAPPYYPVMPQVFADACTLLATQRGFTFEALACCLFLDKEKLDHYKQKSEALDSLCVDYANLVDELYQGTKALNNGTSYGRWLN